MAHQPIFGIATDNMRIEFQRNTRRRVLLLGGIEKKCLETEIKHHFLEQNRVKRE